MRSLIAVTLACALAGAAALDAQQRTTAQRPAAKPKPKPAAKPPAKPAPRPAAVALRQEAASVRCPESLGTGVRTGGEYCFVLAGMDPAEGVVVAIPPRTGDATLRFNLHNRHTYSEEQMKAGRGFALYTAVIGILTLDGELLDRAAIRTEFRTAADVYERISGGVGPGGVKAVAPVGVAPVTVTIPAGIDRVSLLGEVLDATTAAGREMAAPGRPVAIVSNVTVEYRPRK
jgi:hypothetical protein